MIRAPCADQLLAARRRRKESTSKAKRPLSKPRASSRSLTSTTTATSSTFAASLFPRRPTLAPIRSLSGQVGPTCRAPQTRSEQAGVLRTRPEVPDVQGTPAQRAESRIAASSPGSLTQAARHPTPHSESEVPSARPRRRGVPIDECHRHVRPKDGVPWEEFVVTDRLNRLPRLEHPFTASPRKRRRGIVIRADERAEMHEHVVTPAIIRETEIEPAPWSGMKRSPSSASPSM